MLRKRFFHSLLVIALFHFASMALAAAQEEPHAIEGHWEGNIAIQEMELEVIIDFFQDKKDNWLGQIDIPMQGAKDLSLININVQESEVTWDFPAAPGDAFFKASLSDDGNTLSGDFTQFGKVYPFRLLRQGKAQWEKKISPKEALEGFEEFTKEAMKDWNVPGLALAIVKDDEVIFSKGFGKRDTENSLPVTPYTLFAIGSSTKAFTTTLLGLLVDEGKIKWDERVTTYLPSFKLHDDFASQKMTIRDLVTHRSGLPRHDLMWYGSPFSRKELFDRLLHLEPNEDFRTTFQYQNLMFMTAGYLAGQVMDSTWEELVREKILMPLGMSSTNFSVADSQKSADFALPYEEEEEEKGRAKEEKGKKKKEAGPVKEESQKETVVKKMEFRNIDAMGPAGSINANIIDMAQWLKFNINNGKIKDKQIISETNLAEIHAPQMVVKGGIISQLMAFEEMPYIMYGMGWFIQPYRGHRMIHHGGNIDGFSALVSFMPDEKIGVVVLTNLNGTMLPIVLSLNVYDRFLDLEEIEWNERFKMKWELIKKEMKKSKEKEEDILRKKNTQHAHKLEDYTGVYEHPSYGKLVVDSKGKKLTVGYNALNTSLEHWHYEVFRAADEPLQGTKFTFLSNVRGDVDRVSVPFESSVPEIVFTRKAPESMKDPEFLKRFEGKYELMGILVKAELREDGMLTMTVPGQPTYELEPYMGTEFNLKGLSGYSVKFIEEGEKIKEVIFIQPNGIFTAVRNSE